MLVASRRFCCLRGWWSLVAGILEVGGVSLLVSQVSGVSEVDGVSEVLFQRIYCRRGFVVYEVGGFFSHWYLGGWWRLRGWWRLLPVASLVCGISDVGGVSEVGGVSDVGGVSSRWRLRGWRRLSVASLVGSISSCWRLCGGCLLRGCVVFK